MAIEENYWAEAIAQRRGRQLPAVGSRAEPGAGPRPVPARPDVDRVPVDRLPGDRLQQRPSAVHQDDQGSGRPAAQGQGHAARARRHHRRRVPARPRRRARQGLQGPGPDEGGRRLGRRQHRTERRRSTRPTRPRCSSCSGPARSTRSRSGTASPGSSTSAATRTRPCSCPRRSTRRTATCGSRRGRRTRSSPRSSSTGGSAKDVQFPNAWPIEHGPWSELSEGFLGPDYVDQVPDWFKADYCEVLPDARPDQVELQAGRLGRPTTRASRSGWTTTPRRPPASDGPARRRRTADPTVDGD